MYDYLGNEECYILIGAIFKQAKKDYIYHLKRLCRNPKNRDAKREIRKLREFFKSSYFYEFVEVDGNAIITKIEDDFCAERRNKGKSANFLQSF